MELEVDRRRAPLFLFLSRVLKIVVFSRREWQCSEQESHARQELLIVDPWRHEFIRTNLSTSSLSGASLSTVLLSDIYGMIRGNASQRDQSQVNTRHKI
jgi:hypothetical protein